MTVKRKEFVATSNDAAVGKGVLDDDNALVPVPAFRLGKCDQAVTDAVDRFAEALTAAHPPPIFPGVEFVVAGAEAAEITAAGSADPLRRIKGEIE